MTLTFLGTRGYIDARSRRHRRHSVLRIAYRQRAVLIDCGEDWLSRLKALDPAAILLTHAHPDHAGGLKRGAPCPVYAPAEVWATMPRWPLAAREVLRPRETREVSGLRVEPFRVVHSLRAPAVGYRIGTREPPSSTSRTSSRSGRSGRRSPAWTSTCATAPA
jgi:glyoxylase-like metal-dependent hydrolase (beta-lactamase superfamily II)